MKWKNIIIIILLSFLGEINSISALSATCTYTNNIFEIQFSIDSNQKITYQKLTSLGGIIIRNVNVSINDFLDKENNLYCPSSINAVSRSGGRSVEYDFSFSEFSETTKTTFKLSDSKIMTDEPEPEPEPEPEIKVVRVCNYGEYSITLYSDNTIAGVRRYYNVSVNIDSDRFTENCPSEIYVVDSRELGESNATIYSSYVDGSSSISWNGIEKTTTYLIDFCGETRVLKVFQIIGYCLFVIKILVPLLLIILGSIDFAKSVISSDEKSNKEALNSLVKRILAGIIIFLIPNILNYLLLLIDGASENTNKFTNCTTCVLTPFECSE